MIEFDPEKDAANVAKHGISLAMAVHLEYVISVPDGRFREPRFRAYGLIENVYYCLAYTLRHGKVRAISLRRAHKKESGVMSKKKLNLADYPAGPVDDPDNPEWTADDFRNGRTWDDLSDLEKSVFKRPRGRPPVEAPKKLVSLRLDAEVIEALESSGPGWRQRINDILKAALKRDDKVA